MKKIAINGLFLAQQMSGVQRNAKELVIELDKIVPKNKFELIIPSNTVIENISLANIKIVKYGNLNDRWWEQINYLTYVWKYKRIALSLCNTAPLFSPGIVMVCDVIFKHINEFPQEAQKISKYLSRDLQTRIICLFSKKLLTISNFSSSEIKKYYGVKDNKIAIIPCAWQHYSSIDSNGDALRKYKVDKGNYYFAMSNIAKHKNFEWILANAKQHPEHNFVIAGSHNKRHFQQNLDVNFLPNVKYTGYLSDEDAKALMENCKAFISPSFYEGFGIPPLEALSVGTKIIISDIPAHKEVFINSAYYIDVNDHSYDLNSVLNEQVSNGAEILEKYSWNKSAQTLWENIENYLV